MIFCGSTFCGMEHTLDATANEVNAIGSVKIQSGQFDELAVQKKSESYTEEISQEWDYDTALHAQFENSLNAGNVTYTTSQISAILLKRRKYGEFAWQTLDRVDISSQEDALFTYYDRFNQSNCEYEYALVPVIGNTEGNINVNRILSHFDGLFIMERSDGFNTLLETEIVTQKNRPSSAITTIDRRYPYYESNGSSNYYSGQASGLFAKLDAKTRDWSIEDGWQYREALMEFLCNGRPKILKYEDGRMWLINIVGEPSEDASSHPDKVITSFDWVEIGDAQSGVDLYINNFIDYDGNLRRGIL